MKKTISKEFLYMSYLIVIVILYFIGSISPSTLITRKVLGIDIRDVNSKSAGTSNTVMTLGIKYGAIVGVLDILKGLVPVVVLRILFPDTEVIWFVGGLSAVIGHIYPLHMKFKGGKGTATFGGLVLAVAPVYTIGLIILFALTIMAEFLVMTIVMGITTNITEGKYIRLMILCHTKTLWKDSNKN
jgi:glycerol-3-phosphate acyltransferase PlsY